MYGDFPDEQRAHDLALQACLINHILSKKPIENDFEFAIEYRDHLREVRRGIEEGQSDLGE